MAPKEDSNTSKKMEVDATPAAPAKPPAPVPLTPVQEIKANLQLIERAVATLEPRFTLKVLRSVTTLRKKLNAQVLSETIVNTYPNEPNVRRVLLHCLPEEHQVDGAATMDVEPSSVASKTGAAPASESEIYLALLIILYLIDAKSYDQALQLAHVTVEKIQNLNRRSLDPIAAKVYFYLGRLYELKGNLADLRPTLLAAQRTASLRRDDETQATLINLLLRNYLHYNLYQQADKLVSKTSFPESTGNSQLARYLYYLGRIRAVQLNYTEAHTHLQQAIRRAPGPTIAPGFYQTIHKLFVIVELLMGDIPDRGTFRHPVLKKALVPYFQIAQAVRTGDLAKFQTALSTHTSQFTQDATYTLILRLRHNVIKTGIRSLSIAYSRISLRDICLKLHLDSEEDAEYIVGKAVRDGVIDARVDHAQGWMESWRRGTEEGGRDVYISDEPREAFGKRIAFCLNLHNESVKAMRYPLNNHRKDLATAAEAREREKELAKEIVEGDHDDDDDAGLGDF